MRSKKTLKFAAILLGCSMVVISSSCNATKDNNNLPEGELNTPPVNELEYELNTQKTGYIVKGIGTCTDIELIIPKTYNEVSVTEIAERAFENCTKLTSVHISNTIEKIGEDAFLNCNKLEKITVDTENNYFSTQNDILYNKEKTKLVATPKMVGGDVIIPGELNVIENYSYGYLTNVNSFILSEGITQIKDEAFAYSTSIGYVVFPKSVISIGRNIFTMCQALSAVYYRGTQADWNKVNKDASLVTTVYFYSENEPTGQGNYWYELDGEPVEW